MSPRKIGVLVMWLIILLFPPYWVSGYFSDDIGWAFLFSDYAYYYPVLSANFFTNEFSVSIFLVEVIIAGVVTKMLLKEEGGSGSTAAVGGFRPNITSAPSSASAPTASLADELGKLNALRRSGALTEEEFAEEKAKLMAGTAESAPSAKPAAGSQPSGATQDASVTSESGETFPSQRIANAVAMLREKGLKESEIIAPAHKLAWKIGQPLPPLPYLTAEPGLFAAMFGLMGFAFALLMNLFFDGGSIWTFVLMALFFGGFMAIFFVVFANNARGKHNLPEWHQIPG